MFFGVIPKKPLSNMALAMLLRRRCAEKRIRRQSEGCGERRQPYP